MSEDLSPEVVQAALTEAIASALPGTMVTRWAIGIEVIDPAGERVLWAVSPTDQKGWDTLGLLRYIEQVEISAIHRAEAADEGD